MARRSQGCVYRKSKAVIRSGKRRTVKAGFYRVRYKDASGEQRDHVLFLPNGQRVADKSVAEAKLTQILRQVEREAAGLIDPTVESASMPTRVVLARYIQYLRGKQRTRKYVVQALSYIKRMMDTAGIARLADLSEDKIESALARIANGGASPATVNAYRKHVLALARWAVQIARILGRNPVEAIQRRDEEADTRKVRRALAVDEAYQLLAVSGPRRLYYAAAMWSGLRVNELRQLEWRDLVLDSERPCVRLRAVTTKARRGDELPLHPDLVAGLQEARSPSAEPTDRVFETIPSLATFKGGWYMHKGSNGAKERRYRIGDLDRAQIFAEDAQGRSLDLHALRTSFISWLGVYGVDPRAQIMLARHSPHGVTLRNYQDFGLFDLWAEIAKLPAICWKADPELAKATGTCDIRPGKVARPVALRVGREGIKVAASGRTHESVSSPCQDRKTLQNKGETTFSGPQTHWAMPDLNRRPPPCKGGALAN